MSREEKDSFDYLTFFNRFRSPHGRGIQR